MAKEFEREKLPVALITAMTAMASQTGTNRIIQGVAISHVCGDPNLPPEADQRLRREIVMNALKALHEDVKQPTVSPLPAGFAAQAH